jgi:hypothetical protein
MVSALYDDFDAFQRDNVAGKDLFAAGQTELTV